MAKKAVFTLKKPIKRGDTEITEVELRAPDAGSLRGLKVGDILNLDVTQTRLLIPRISNITEAEFDQISKDNLSDMTEIMTEVTYFFV